MVKTYASGSGGSCGRGLGGGSGRAGHGGGGRDGLISSSTGCAGGSGGSSGGGRGNDRGDGRDDGRSTGGAVLSIEVHDLCRLLSTASLGRAVLKSVAEVGAAAEAGNISRAAAKLAGLALHVGDAGLL